MTTLRTIFGILGLARGGRAIFFATIVLSVVASLSEAVGIFTFIPLLQSTGVQFSDDNPAFLGSMLQWMTAMPLEERITTIAALILAIVAIRAVIEFGTKLLVSLLRRMVEHCLAASMFNEILHVQLSYIDHQKSGRITAQMENFVFEISRIIQNVAIIMFNGILVIGYVALMFVISVQLTAFAIGFLLLISALVAFILLRQGRYGRALVSANIDYHQAVSECASHLRMIRLLGAEKSRVAHFGTVLHGKLLNNFKMHLVTSTMQPIFTLSGGAFLSAILLFGVARHQGDDGGWLTFAIVLFAILYRMMAPVSVMNTARSELKGDLPVLKELQRFRDECAAHRVINGSQLVAALARGISFENVSFSYSTAADDNRSQSEPSQLTSINLDIRKGEMVALVGPTGAGKTTLVNLIVRLYDATHGRILIDGVDIRELDIYQWRRRIGFVSQDIAMFNGTVADNLVVAKPDANRSEMLEALRLAGASDLLAILRDGLDTVVGERGIAVSAGQRQRISLARAFLQKPDVLILDEATSHLDTLTERAVRESIDRFRGNTTIIVIAHRLHTITQADKIFVLSNGKILESGRHAELVGHGRLYARMVAGQSIDAPQSLT